MTEPKEICSVDLGSSMRENEYTLYEDGRVLRYYDKNPWSNNNENWLEAKTLGDDIKQRLLDECPEELKEKARELLYLGLFVRTLTCSTSKLPHRWGGVLL